MSDLLSELPTLIRAELARRRVTQLDLSREINSNASTITRLLQGKGMCDAATLLRLCDWLRVEPLIIGDPQWMAAYQRGRDDVVAQVGAVLRGGDDDD